MKRLLLPCLCFLFLFSHAQSPHKPAPFNFRVDTTKAPLISFTGDSTRTASVWIERYDKALDSQYHLEQDYTFEFRLRQYYLESNFDNVFVMTLRQGKWLARYFDRNNGLGDRVVFTERTVDQSCVNQLWELLVQNNVLNLPAQRALANQMVSYEVDTTNLPYANMRTLSMTDGAAYEFSLRNQTEQRNYGYDCPQTYLKQYSNVKELFQAVMLITLIEKFLGHPLRVC